MKEVNTMENLTPGQIHANAQRMQQEGATHAASLFGAAASGKLDEELHHRKEPAEPQEQVEIGGEAPKIDGKDSASVEAGHKTMGESGSTQLKDDTNEPSAEEILQKGPDIPPESLQAAGGIVRAQMAQKEKKEELARTKPLGEPKLLEMRLEESIKMMDIHDLYSCKPLPPIMDDDPECAEEIRETQERG
jgi:hypothetical protein